ncbi:prenyltransferase/squalene oxidase repeat-containing protein [Streptomyces sp. NPDC060194]|uniref:prenyltransferase/squalene oxidase repeat-containing protein n=1 Tax=Streptomyces sp. NPDC060194 TaxID=3347069 RepID=UPI003669366C
MNLRRQAAALASAAVLCAVAAPVAAADETASPSPSAPALPDGLYGKGDPTYSGVWRQSYALLALDTVGVRPAESAVSWLTGQQCADGGFASYRADTAKACDAKTEDTNATAIAVQALSALGGQDAAVKKATDWLKSVQNADGGWSYNPGGASDANSTGVVAGAFDAAGTDAEDVAKGGKSAADALLGFQLDCKAKEADRGAFAYQPTDGKLTADAKATTGAVLGLEGDGFVLDAPDAGEKGEAPKALACPASSAGPDDDASADAGSAWLAARLAAGDHHFTAATPGSDEKKPDFGTTADAVIALAAGDHLDAAKSSYGWLTENAGDWASSDPSAAAQLVLGAHATGQDPRKAGGTDYVALLTDMGPAPAAAAPSKSAAERAANGKDDQQQSDGDSLSVWWIIGVGLVAGIGIGFLISARKKSQG